MRNKAYLLSGGLVTLVVEAASLRFLPRLLAVGLMNLGTPSTIVGGVGLRGIRVCGGVTGDVLTWDWSGPSLYVCSGGREALLSSIRDSMVLMLWRRPWHSSS